MKCPRYFTIISNNDDDEEEDTEKKSALIVIIIIIIIIIIIKAHCLTMLRSKSQITVYYHFFNITWSNKFLI